MIYYPLSILMLAGIQNILIISTERDLPIYQELFGTGNQLGLDIHYAVQDNPRGLADAFLVGEQFIGNDRVCLVLGDNVFYGHGFGGLLQTVSQRESGATIFGYYVTDPRAYGVVETDIDGNAISIEEKPKDPKSYYAVPGLYFYDNNIVNIAKGIKPSKRDEIEITDVNIAYMNIKKLKVEILGRGMAWLDTGTHDALLEASNFVAAIQKRQGLYVSCIEEIAFRKGFINKAQLMQLAEPLLKIEYGRYLVRVAEERI